MRRIALALSLALTTPALATDGALEINQTCAVQTGCFPGDTPGFPVTIDGTAGRSYRLTSDLSTSSQSVRIIQISQDHVSLDLNGFTVGVCEAAGFCGIGGDESTHAIAAPGVNGLEIRSGAIIGAVGDCIRAGTDANLHDLRIAECGTGLDTGLGTLIQRVHVIDSRGTGIRVSGASTISNSVVRGSAGAAVSVGVDAMLIDSVIRDNARAVDGVIGRGGYRGCLISGNNQGNENQSIPSSFRDLGGNFCGTDTTCP